MSEWIPVGSGFAGIAVWFCPGCLRSGVLVRNTKPGDRPCDPASRFGAQQEHDALARKCVGWRVLFVAPDDWVRGAKRIMEFYARHTPEKAPALTASTVPQIRRRHKWPRKRLEAGS
jgi:hypothetical protein